MAAGTLDPGVAAVLDGMADLHCHSGPNPFPREFTHIEAAHDAARLHMSAILVKSHHHNTVMDLLSMGAALEAEPVKVFGGIVLNGLVGGINPEAVAMSLRWGGAPCGSRRSLHAPMRPLILKGAASRRHLCPCRLRPWWTCTTRRASCCAGWSGARPDRRE